MFEARTAGDMKKEKTAELNAAQDVVKKAQSDFDSASKHFEKDKADREEAEKHVDKATQEHGIATYELQQKQGVWDLLKELKTQIAKFYGTLDTLVENIEAGEPVEGEGPWERIEKELRQGGELLRWLRQDPRRCTCSGICKRMPVEDCRCLWEGTTLPEAAWV